MPVAALFFVFFSSIADCCLLESVAELIESAAAGSEELSTTATTVSVGLSSLFPLFGSLLPQLQKLAKTSEEKGKKKGGLKVALVAARHSHLLVILLGPPVLHAVLDTEFKLCTVLLLLRTINSSVMEATFGGYLVYSRGTGNCCRFQT